MKQRIVNILSRLDENKLRMLRDLFRSNPHKKAEKFKIVFDVLEALRGQNDISINLIQKKATSMKYPKVSVDTFRKDFKEFADCFYEFVLEKIQDSLIIDCARRIERIKLYRHCGLNNEALKLIDETTTMLTGTPYEALLINLNNIKKIIKFDKDPKKFKADIENVEKSNASILTNILITGEAEAFYHRTFELINKGPLFYNDQTREYEKLMTMDIASLADDGIPEKSKGYIYAAKMNLAALSYNEREVNRYWSLLSSQNQPLDGVIADLIQYILISFNFKDALSVEARVKELKELSSRNLISDPSVNFLINLFELKIMIRSDAHAAEKSARLDAFCHAFDTTKPGMAVNLVAMGELEILGTALYLRGWEEAENRLGVLIGDYHPGSTAMAYRGFLYLLRIIVKFEIFKAQRGLGKNYGRLLEVLTTEAQSSLQYVKRSGSAGDSFLKSSMRIFISIYRDPEFQIYMVGNKTSGHPKSILAPYHTKLLNNLGAIQRSYFHKATRNIFDLEDYLDNNFLR